MNIVVGILTLLLYLFTITIILPKFTDNIRIVTSIINTVIPIIYCILNHYFIKNVFKDIEKIQIEY